MDRDNDSSMSPTTGTGGDPMQQQQQQIVVVKGAGTSQVNGVYKLDGTYQGIPKYSKSGGQWKKDSSNDDNDNADDDDCCTFYIFQYQFDEQDGGGKYWFLSIIPDGFLPGSHLDEDYYRVPVTESCQHLPPSHGWVREHQGQKPAPTLEFCTHQQDENMGSFLDRRSEALSSAEKDRLEKENVNLMAQNKQQQDEMAKLTKQHKKAEKKSKAEIASLRTSLAQYEDMEREELEAECQTLQEKINPFEQLDQNKISLQESITQCQEDAHAVQEDMNRHDVDMLRLRNALECKRAAKRARNGGDGQTSQSSMP